MGLETAAKLTTLRYNEYYAKTQNEGLSTLHAARYLPDLLLIDPRNEQLYIDVASAIFNHDSSKSYKSLYVLQLGFAATGSQAIKYCMQDIAAKAEVNLEQVVGQQPTEELKIVQELAMLQGDIDTEKLGKEIFRIVHKMCNG